MSLKANDQMAHPHYPGHACPISDRLEERVSATFPGRNRPETAPCCARAEQVIAQLKGAKKASADLIGADTLRGGPVTAQIAILEADRRHMQDRLRESERALGMLLSNLPGMAYRFRNDRDWTMEFVSQGCLELTGYQPAGLIDNTRIAFAELIHSDDREGVWNAVQSAIQRREPYQLTYRIIPRSREEKWVWEQGRAIFSTAGLAVAREGFITDITERKQIEEALKLSEERYRTLIETIDDLVHVKDMDGRYLIANSAMVRRFGLDREQIVGRTALDLYNPEEATQVMERDRQVMKTGISSDAEEIHQWGDGEVRHYHVRKVPLVDKHGKVAGVVTVSRDITERKQAEEARRASADSLRRTTEGIVEAMSTVTELRDPYTAGHQRRVSKLAYAIASAMGLPEATQDAVRLAGNIHDVGKISVPAEILCKSGPLSDVELQMIRCHPQSAYDIVKGIEFTWPIAEPILQHHERLDGSGYPHGLAGDAILLEARILAVADVVEAMCSHRPYRPALGLEASLEEISQQKGILYEADVVDACLRVFAHEGFTFD